MNIYCFWFYSCSFNLQEAFWFISVHLDFYCSAHLVELNTPGLRSHWIWSTAYTLFGFGPKPGLVLQKIIRSQSSRLKSGSVRSSLTRCHYACDDVSSKTQKQRTRTSRSWWTQLNPDFKICLLDLHCFANGKQFKCTNLSMLWVFF